MIYYVLLYSIWLKKLTVQNIVIGGGAGAIPPLVGWAAATGSLNIPSLFLFAIVFLWTPPHFWALALVRRNDYARAGVPDAAGRAGRNSRPLADLRLYPGTGRLDPVDAGPAHHRQLFSCIRRWRWAPG